MSRVVLDLKGLNCPLPVLRANKAIKSMTGGEELESHVTDRAAPNDFREFCESTGNVFVSCEETDTHTVIVIRKKP